MSNQLSITQPTVDIYNNKVTTTSLDIAKCFLKRHDNVLRTISNLECSPEFTALNFELSTYTDCTGRTLPVYNITRDGFIFLVTGFTGKKAAQFKEAYIKAFNEMERVLLNQAMPKLSYRTVQVSKVNIEALINHMEWIYKYYKVYNLLEVSRMLQSDFGAKLHDHIIDGYLNARSII